jgi:hypothetical protein
MSLEIPEEQVAAVEENELGPVRRETCMPDSAVGHLERRALAAAIDPDQRADRIDRFRRVEIDERPIP